jgi:hypothetical protein
VFIWIAPRLKMDGALRAALPEILAGGRNPPQLATTHPGFHVPGDLRAGNVSVSRTSAHTGGGNNSFSQ